MSDERRVVRTQFSLDPETDAAIDRIAREMAEAVGMGYPNRSQAIREMVRTFDVKAWAAEYFRARTAA